MNVFELYAKVSVNKSQAVNDIRAIETAGKQSSVSMGKNFQKLGDNVGKWIKRGAVVAAGAIAALGVTSVKNFAKMDTGMREVFTLMPGLSKKAKDQMTADVKEISRAIGVLPNETIPALYQAISAGVPPDNVFDFMEIAGKAAKAGVTDLETSVDALSTVVNAYGSDVISATEASDIMFTAVRLGITTFGELSRYLFQVTPVAAAVGVSFNQVAAAMAEITAKGVPTRVAATQLRQMLVELSRAGGETAEIFEELSGQTFQDFMDEGNDLSDVLELMQEYADANSISLMDMFSSVEGGMAALNLGGQNLDSFRVKLGEMDETALATEMAFQEMADGIQFRLDQLAAWWQTVQINIGEELQAGLADLLTWIEANQDRIEQGLVRMFQGLISSLKWILDNGHAVKTALLVMAAGLFAVYAITNPIQAGLALVVIGIGAVSFAATKTKDSLSELSGEMQTLEGATDKGESAVQEFADTLSIAEKAAREFKEEIAGIDSAFIQIDPLDMSTGFSRFFSSVLSGVKKVTTAMAEWGESSTSQFLTGWEMAASSIQGYADTIEWTIGSLRDGGVLLAEDWKGNSEEVLESWDGLITGIASGANKFLSSISAMVRGNRELKKSHEETNAAIIQTEVDKVAALEQTRDDNLEDLQADLATQTISQAEYATAVAKIHADYAQDVIDAGTARTDALNDETDAYEDAKETIWDILKEMGKNLLVAIREELMLQSGKHLVMAAAAALTIATAALAPGHLLAAGVLAAGATGLALAGFAKGGIATSPTYGVIGEAGVSEGVIPLTARNLAAIGRAIASASGMSREPLGTTGIPGLSGGSVQLSDTAYPQIGGVSGSGSGIVPSIGETHVQIVIENPVIREDSDIDKLVEGIESSFEQTRRGLGWAGAT